MDAHREALERQKQVNSFIADFHRWRNGTIVGLTEVIDRLISKSKTDLDPHITENIKNAKERRKRLQDWFLPKNVGGVIDEFFAKEKPPVPREDLTRTLQARKNEKAKETRRNNSGQKRQRDLFLFPETVSSDDDTVAKRGKPAVS